MDDFTKNRILDLARKGNITAAQLAERFNVRSDVITRICKRAGIELKKQDWNYSMERDLKRDAERRRKGKR